MSASVPTHVSLEKQLLNKQLPIGVFDSGMGGLTVLRALQAALPNERFLYLGDTARLPYGTKSPDTIIRYSSQAAAFLLERGVKCLVIACNTASATALDVLRQQHPQIPILGVVEPGAVAGCRASVKGKVVVIATEGTVRGGAYQRAIRQLNPAVHVVAQACPLFVPLAEEGWLNGPIVSAVAKRYLMPLFDVPDAPDTLLLGCTHFPVFYPVLHELLGDAVHIVDSAQTTAEALVGMLNKRNDLRAELPAAVDESVGQFMVTDGPERFARVAGYFLAQPLPVDAVTWIDPTFSK